MFEHTFVAIDSLSRLLRFDSRSYDLVRDEAHPTSADTVAS